MRALSGSLQDNDQKLIINVLEGQVLQEDVVMTRPGTGQIHPTQNAKLPFPDRRSLPTSMLLNQIVKLYLPRSKNPTTREPAN